MMKSVRRKGEWWIENVPECDLVGPYNTKKEADEDKAGLARTEKNMDNRSFWTCEKDTQPLTPVVLRKNKSGELFALFPEEAVDNAEHCKCYRLSEGYAAADYTKCMRISKAATAKESEKILAALAKLKWKNLKVIKRATSLMHEKRKNDNE